MAEVKVGVSRGVGVQIVVPGGNVGRLREVRVVIVAAGFVLHVRAPGDIGALVPADAGFRSPEREVPAAEIEVRHLLAAAPAALIRLRGNTQPEAVDVRVFLRKRQACTVPFQGNPQAQVISVFHGQAVRQRKHRRDRERTALRHVVFNLKITAVHVDGLLTGARKQKRKCFRGTEKNRTLVLQGPFFFRIM